MTRVVNVAATRAHAIAPTPTGGAKGKQDGRAATLCVSGPCGESGMPGKRGSQRAAGVTKRPVQGITDLAFA